MNRRLNSTGRISIKRDAFAIRLIDDPAGGPSRFIADLSGLTGLGLSPAGQVIVEPYVKQSSMRFDYGTISNLRAPADTTLFEIDRGASVQFRIKVVEPNMNPGRLLALADQIRPLDEWDDSSRKSILPLREADLGEQVWRLDVANDVAPCLTINRRIADLRTRLDVDPVLQGAIYCVAIRDVIRILLAEDADPEAGWVKDWRMFIEDLIGRELPDDTVQGDPLEYLIEEAVDRFAARQGWATAAAPVPTQVEADYE